MRLLICAGGTGGGVYPALAVHEALMVSHPEAETLWVGGEGGMEAGLVSRAGIAFRTIPAAGVHGVGLNALPRNLLQLGRGVFAAGRILKEYRPDVLMFTGGYVAFPMAVAGRHVPSLLCVPDIEPGLAIRSIARFARVITVPSESSRCYFPSTAPVQVTGYPVRSGLAGWTRERARKFFSLPQDAFTLLVFGGSKGAHSINMALLENLPGLLARVHVIHISGELDWPTVQASGRGLPADLSGRYHAYPYLHEEMGAALAAADLVVSRAGASTLGEFPLFGLPAVLVPYPHAWRYQKVNADELVGRGAAVLVEDANLLQDLPQVIFSLLGDATRLDAMRTAMRSLSHPHASAMIAAELERLGRKEQVPS